MSDLFRALLLKDLKLMLLPGLAWLAFNLVFIALEFFAGIIGASDLAVSIESDEFFGWGILLAITTAIFAPGMMFKEADTRTIRFLDQLPVSRFVLFASRYLSLLIWLIGGYAVYQVLDAMIIAWFSLGTPQISIFKVYGSLVLAGAYFIVLFLPVMMVLSLLRGAYAWMATATLFYFAVVYGLELKISEAANIEYRHRNILAVTDLKFVENTVLWSTQPAIVLFVLGIASLLLSAISYHYIGKAMPMVGVLRLWRYIWVKVVVVLSSAALLAVVASKQFADDREARAEAFHAKAEQIAENSTELEVSETDSFIWMMEARDEDSFGPIVDQGERIYAELLEAFDLKSFELGQRITVVPTDKIQAYAAGTAHWKRIKMSRDLKDLERIETVFRHELVHVLIEIWSDGGLREHFDSTGTFHEGTAQYFEQASQTKLERILRQAVVNHTWNRFSFDDLFNYKSINSERGRPFVYSYGWLFVASIVEKHGDEIIPKIAEAFREFRGSDFEGLLLWQSVLKECGISIEEVRSDFMLRLIGLEEENAELIAKLPKPEATLIEKDGTYFLRPSVVSELNGASLIVDFDSSGRYKQTAEPNKDGLIEVPQNLVEAERVEVQLGWVIRKAEDDESNKTLSEVYWSNVDSVRLSERDL